MTPGKCVWCFDPTNGTDLYCATCGPVARSSPVPCSVYPNEHLPTLGGPCAECSEAQRSRDQRAARLQPVLDQLVAIRALLKGHPTVDVMLDNAIASLKRDITSG